MLDRIKRALGLPLGTENTEDDFLLEQFIEMYSNALMLEINETTIPSQLDFILVEVVVSRWNRRGSEHLKAESVDVVSNTFYEDIFSPYKFFIETYKSNQKPVPIKTGFRML
ncbi:phage head-tail connector protein [Planococcus sp. SIMBA_143]